MDQLTVTEHDTRLNPWIQRIKECRGSGMTVEAWCKPNEINAKTYCYWLRKIKKEVSEVLPEKSKQVPAPFAERKAFTEAHASRLTCISILPVDMPICAKPLTDWDYPEEFAYVNYNHVRPHSFNGYRTPHQARITP